MKNNKRVIAYIVGFAIVIVWGTTFISSKILLQQLEPIEILCYRFLIGYLTLTIIKPKPMPFRGFVMEGWCFLAGVLSVTIYFMCESSALQYTTAGNVGIIVSLAPIFTALLSFFFIKEEKPDFMYFIGFIVAISGIILINIETILDFHFDMLGYALAICAAFTWALYVIVLKGKIKFEKYILEATKRILFYGIVSSIPIYFLRGIKPDFSILSQGQVWGNLLFLGVFASGIGYLGWNWIVTILGAVKATAYIYTIPLVTFLAAFLILDEKITIFTGVGSALVIIGLILSEKRKKIQK